MIEEEEVSASKKRNAWRRRRQRCCLMQPTNSFESFPVYSFTAVRIHCIHDRIHNHIHHHIHNCIHVHFRYQLVTNSLPTCYQSLNMILSYLFRPALKARSRFSWSPFYVEIILIIYPLHFMAYLVREVLEPSIAPFRPSIQFVVPESLAVRRID